MLHLCLGKSDDRLFLIGFLGEYRNVHLRGGLVVVDATFYEFFGLLPDVRPSAIANLRADNATHLSWSRRFWYEDVTTCFTTLDLQELFELEHPALAAQIALRLRSTKVKRLFIKSRTLLPSLKRG